jgi:hypothetical protein
MLLNASDVQQIPNDHLIRFIDSLKKERSIVLKLMSTISSKEIRFQELSFLIISNPIQYHWAIDNEKNLMASFSLEQLQNILEKLLKNGEVFVSPLMKRLKVSDFPWWIFEYRNDVVQMFFEVYKQFLKENLEKTQLPIIQNHFQFLNPQQKEQFESILLGIPFHKFYPNDVISIFLGNPQGIFWEILYAVRKEQLFQNYFIPAIESEINKSDPNQHTLKDLSIRILKPSGKML